MGPIMALAVLLSVAAGSEGKRPRDEAFLQSNPGVSVYFLREDLYEGAKFSLVPLSVPGFVVPAAQRRVAERLPFTRESLPVALKLLGVARGSRTEWGLRHYIRKCQTPASEAKKTFCAYSLESLEERLTSELGPRFTAFQTAYISQPRGDGNATWQEYTVTAMPFRRKIHSTSISCHQVPYVNVVYYCHFNHEPELFKVFLEGEDGTSLDALIACHEDTRAWEPDHVAFKFLKAKPGEETICHFFGERHYLCVAKE